MMKDMALRGIARRFLIPPLRRGSTSKSLSYGTEANKNPSGTSVCIAMSGGVDSAVSAALLKEQGYKVHAVHMQNWDSDDEDTAGGVKISGRRRSLGPRVCTSDEDWRDASETCARLDIPLTRVSFVSEYWNEVFVPFLDSLERNETPNPDVLCNRVIKFARLREWALERFDLFATGHYAQIRDENELWRPKDLGNDQTYFLSSLQGESFERCLFPLGDVTKTQVREVAKQQNLNRVQSKKSSVGICFIGKRHFAEFVAQYMDPDGPVMRRGPIVDFDTGKVLGEHSGLITRTLGQGAAIGGLPHKYFVCGKDVMTSTLLVCSGTNHPSLFTRDCRVRGFSWVNEVNQRDLAEMMEDGSGLSCVTRYREHDVPCRIEKESTETSEDGLSLQIRFEEPVRAVTPGQVLVLYRGDRCLGGGIISSA